MPSVSQENHSNKARNRDLVKHEGVHLSLAMLVRNEHIMTLLKPDVCKLYLHSAYRCCCRSCPWKDCFCTSITIVYLIWNCLHYITEVGSTLFYWLLIKAGVKSVCVTMNGVNLGELADDNFFLLQLNA